MLPKSVFTEGPLPGYGTKVMSTFAMLELSNPGERAAGTDVAMVKLSGLARAARADRERVVRRRRGHDDRVAPASR
jgi:hypothetical protein